MENQNVSIMESVDIRMLFTLLIIFSESKVLESILAKKKLLNEIFAYFILSH